jgi:hypothetical protein
MASALTRKQCANGNDCKQPSAALCEGCSKALCTKHFIDHRRLLGEEMDAIICQHDQFQHTLNQQTTNSDSHPLIKQIDEWEKESIIKIRQKAKEIREQLLNLTTAHTVDLSKKLRNVSEKLKEAREHDSFVETDLQQWKTTIEGLKANFASPSTFTINRQHEIPLVRNISINLGGTIELFERVSDNRIRIEENGQVAIQNASAVHSYTELRGKNEYTSGRHEIRLCIEQSADIWTFLGINSKSVPLQNQSQSSKSTYGWTNNNCLWLNGHGQKPTSAPRIEMKTNDIINLIFDCDNQKISMINERTLARHELTININYCPFPWQLHVNLSEPQSRVRIL